MRDPTQHDELLARTLADAAGAGVAHQHRLSPIHEDFLPERQPFLIHLRSEPDAERVVAAAIQIATAEAFDSESPEFTGRTVCGFIVHDAHPTQRARALTQAARIRKPDGRSHFLRFWDPRVIWHLPRCLPATHWASLHAALGQWMYFDPMRQLAALPASGDVPPSTSAAHITNPLAIKDQTWQRLERVGPVNKVLALSWDWGLQPTHSLACQTDELVMRSIQLGFDSEQDVLVFAACGLTGHLQFDQHPQIRAALQRAASAGLSLQSALAPFDDNFWDRLRADTGWLNALHAIPEHSEAKRAAS
ncbi:DUF4123 domain-containing protein [Pseudorhodoferax sp.]|uniref:DUF4123 domain-containing protein n=1 Tax=Pseudorhodoferax sp. TaxID=1993553 RepID=UPI0039E67498